MISLTSNNQNHTIYKEKYIFIQTARETQLEFSVTKKTKKPILTIRVVRGEV